MMAWVLLSRAGKELSVDVLYNKSLCPKVQGGTPGKVAPLGLMRVWAAGAAERLTEWQSGQIYFGQTTDVRTFV